MNFKSILGSFVSLITLSLFIVVPVFAQYETASPTPNLSPEIGTVNSYELFWPITAGVVSGESSYPLKLLKENIREFFIFSNSKKAEYSVSLSSKRVVEAEKLFLQKKDYTNAKLSLDVAQQKRERARDLLKKTEDTGKNVSNYKDSMFDTLERQRALLNYLSSQIPKEQKQAIDKNISQLNSVLSTLQ